MTELLAALTELVTEITRTVRLFREQLEKEKDGGRKRGD